MRGSERTFSLTKLIPASSASAAMPLTPREIAGDHARTEAKSAVVGNADRVALVGRANNRCHRTEYLVVMRALPGHDVGEHRRRIPGTRPVRHLAAEQKSRTAFDAVQDLRMDLVARSRLPAAKLGALRPRIAHRVGAHLLRPAPLERTRTSSTTMKRLPAMQLWPPFTMRAVAQIRAATSTSASSRTTYASEPPTRVRTS